MLCLIVRRPVGLELSCGSGYSSEGGSRILEWGGGVNLKWRTHT